MDVIKSNDSKNKIVDTALKSNILIRYDSSFKGSSTKKVNGPSPPVKSSPKLKITLPLMESPSAQCKVSRWLNNCSHINFNMFQRPQTSLNCVPYSGKDTLKFDSCREKTVKQNILVRQDFNKDNEKEEVNKSEPVIGKPDIRQSIDSNSSSSKRKLSIAEAPMSPESRKKSELCLYLQLMDLKHPEQKNGTVLKNRRSTRVKNLMIMYEKKELERKLSIEAKVKDGQSSQTYDSSNALSKKSFQELNMISELEDMDSLDAAFFCNNFRPKHVPMHVLGAKVDFEIIMDDYVDEFKKMERLQLQKLKKTNMKKALKQKRQEVMRKMVFQRNLKHKQERLSLNSKRKYKKITNVNYSSSPRRMLRSSNNKKFILENMRSKKKRVEKNKKAVSKSLRNSDDTEHTEIIQMKGTPVQKTKKVEEILQLKKIKSKSNMKVVEDENAELLVSYFDDVKEFSSNNLEDNIQLKDTKETQFKEIQMRKLKLNQVKAAKEIQSRNIKDVESRDYEDIGDISMDLSNVQARNVKMNVLGMNIEDQNHSKIKIYNFKSKGKGNLDEESIPKLTIQSKSIEYCEEFRRHNNIPSKIIKYNFKSTKEENIKLITGQSVKVATSLEEKKIESLEINLKHIDERKVNTLPQNTDKEKIIILQDVKVFEVTQIPLYDVEGNNVKISEQFNSKNSDLKQSKSGDDKIVGLNQTKSIIDTEETKSIDEKVIDAKPTKLSEININSKQTTLPGVEEKIEPKQNKIILKKQTELKETEEITLTVPKDKTVFNVFDLMDTNADVNKIAPEDEILSSIEQKRKKILMLEKSPLQQSKKIRYNFDLLDIIGVEKTSEAVATEDVECLIELERAQESCVLEISDEDQSEEVAGVAMENVEHEMHAIVHASEPSSSTTEQKPVFSAKTLEDIEKKYSTLTIDAENDLSNDAISDNSLELGSLDGSPGIDVLQRSYTLEEREYNVNIAISEHNYTRSPGSLPFEVDFDIECINIENVACLPECSDALPAAIVPEMSEKSFTLSQIQTLDDIKRIIHEDLIITTVSTPESPNQSVLPKAIEEIDPCPVTNASVGDNLSIISEESSKSDSNKIIIDNNEKIIAVDSCSPVIALGKTSLYKLSSCSKASSTLAEKTNDILCDIKELVSPKLNKINGLQNHDDFNGFNFTAEQRQSPRLIEFNSRKTSLKKNEVKSLHRNLLQNKRKLSKNSECNKEEFDTTLWSPSQKTGKCEKKSAHAIDIFEGNGDMLDAYYFDYNLIVTQDLMISFWTQSALGFMLEAQNMWIPRGSMQRLALDNNCVQKRSKECVISNENSFAYVELWTKEHKSDKRERPVADVFAVIYFWRNRQLGPEKKFLQLENINGFADDVKYVVLKNTAMILVSWRIVRDDTTSSIIHCYQLASDFQTIVSIKEMESVEHTISSLHNIEDCDTLVMGCGEKKVTLWNLEHGYIVATIDTSDSLPEPTNLWVKCDRGFLFLLQLCADNNLKLIAINGINHSWKRLQIYKPPPLGLDKFQGVSIDNGILIAFYSNGILCWNVQSGDLIMEELCNDVKYLPSGKHIITYTSDNQLQVKNALSFLITNYDFSET